MTIYAAADGSALGNPGPMGWAWFIDEDTWAAGGAANGTNNIGELLAVLNLLNATSEAGLADEPLVIACDSTYVINSLTKWLPGWKRKGWKKADGKAVNNQELMIALDKALTGREVKFKWVKGHAGNYGNEAADQRARAVAEAYKLGKEPDSGPGLNSRSAAKVKTPAKEKEMFCFDDSLQVEISHQRLFGSDSNLETVAGAKAILIDPRGAEVSAASMQRSIRFLAKESEPEITNQVALQVGQADLITQSVRYQGAVGASTYQVSTLWKNDSGYHSLEFIQWTEQN